MAVQRRYLVSQVRQDLVRKMVFVAGPRQVGKTTLALSLPGASAGYFSKDYLTPEGIRVSPALALLDRLI